MPEIKKRIIAFATQIETNVTYIKYQSNSYLREESFKKVSIRYNTK